jgi:hypothetical protein
MHVHHQPEIRDAHLREGLVAQNAGVVDEDIDAAPGRHHAFDHGRDTSLVGDRRGRCNRFSASRNDFIGNARCGCLIHIVDDDLGALSRQQQRMSSTQPATSARNDRDPRFQLHRISRH